MRRGRSDAAEASRLADVDDNLTRIGAQHIQAHMTQLSQRDIKYIQRTDFSDLGWLHGYDKFEPSVSIYHAKSFRLLQLICSYGIEAVIDDMSNLVRRISLFGIAVRLNHSILYVRNLTEGPPLQMFEFITSCCGEHRFVSLY